MGDRTLREYLDFAGLLACNVNPFMPSLSDAGFSWRDAMELIGAHGAFYCKAFCKRTVYLSVEAYYLLKECKQRKPADADAAKLLELLRGAGEMDADLMRQAAGLEKRAFDRAFGFLLENLYVTACGEHRRLNPDWSTLRYCTAEQWEKLAVRPALPCGDARGALLAILTRTMPEKEAEKLLG